MSCALPRLAAFVFATCLATFGVASFALADSASDSKPQGDYLVQALHGGKIYIHGRYRYEHVDQEGIARDANAHTARARIGLQSGEVKGVSALVEFEGTTSFGDNFNDTVAGRTEFPVVADPDSLELNQAYLNLTAIPDTVVRGGRTRVVLDNARFVGDVGFRQNQQTFDVGMFVNKTIPDTTLTYAYVFQVNRIFGSESSVGTFDSKSHLANASYSGFKPVKLTAYGYFIDVHESAANSSRSYGLRAAGKYPIGNDVTVLYAGEYATQSADGDNTANYTERYFLIEPGISYAGATAKIGYEVLSGDGTNSFRTPLATGHKFQGWADIFLTTPGAGIEDLYVSLMYKVKGVADIVDGIKLVGVYHDFGAERTSSDYGSEIDFLIAKTFFKHFTPSIKYASYDAENFATDTEKIWLAVDVKY